MKCEDINSPSGCSLDYIEYEDNGDMSSVLYDRTCEPTSVSEDKVVNEYGTRLIDLCIANDFIIVNGRTGRNPSVLLT